MNAIIQFRISIQYRTLSAPHKKGIYYSVYTREVSPSANQKTFDNAKQTEKGCWEYLHLRIRWKL